MKDRIPIFRYQTHSLFDLCNKEAVYATYGEAWKQHAPQKGFLLNGKKMNHPKINSCHFFMHILCGEVANAVRYIEIDR